MTYFYDPATSVVTGNGFFRLDFFTTAPDVWNISPLNYDLHCIFAIIGFVGAEMMGLIRVGSGRSMTMVSKTSSS